MTDVRDTTGSHLSQGIDCHRKRRKVIGWAIGLAVGSVAALVPVIGIAGGDSSVTAEKRFSGARLTADASGPQIVELFTSQGCSSCPPADRLAGKMRERDDVLVLSYNVTYWDYLGWRDTLATAEGTTRQRGYARFRGDKKVYTPQMVVNGVSHVVGSIANRVDSELSKQKDTRVKLLWHRDGDDLVLSTVSTGGRDLSGMRLVLVNYVPEVTVAVGGGENSGREITYYNVVKGFTKIGSWGRRDSVRVSDFQRKSGNSGQFALLLQDGEFGEIVGAIKNVT